jgi:hypothetical protein
LGAGTPNGRLTPTSAETGARAGAYCSIGIQSGRLYKMAAFRSVIQRDSRGLCWLRLSRFSQERSMTPQKVWPEEAEPQRKRSLRLAQQCLTCIDVLQRSLEQQAPKEALLHVTRLQNHARQIELEMEQARVEAKRWGRHSKEARALVQDVAQTITQEVAVLKRNINEGLLDEALIELAEQQGRAIEIQVLLVGALVVSK